jgi:hypothetical protein
MKQKIPEEQPSHTPKGTNTKQQKAVNNGLWLDNETLQETLMCTESWTG